MVKFARDEMIGKHILVGIAYLGPDKKLERVEMNHGTVIAAGGNSVEYKISGRDKTQTIPYNPNFFEKSDPEAVYTLAGTGEEISNVDIVVKFEVRTKEGTS